MPEQLGKAWPSWKQGDNTRIKMIKTAKIVENDVNIQSYTYVRQKSCNNATLYPLPRVINISANLTMTCHRNQHNAAGAPRRCLRQLLLSRAAWWAAMAHSWEKQLLKLLWRWWYVMGSTQFRRCRAEFSTFHCSLYMSRKGTRQKRRSQIVVVNSPVNMKIVLENCASQNMLLKDIVVLKLIV